MQLYVIMLCNHIYSSPCSYYVRYNIGMITVYLYVFIILNLIRQGISR